MRHFLVLFAALLMALMVAGCNGSDPVSSEDRPSIERGIQGKIVGPNGKPIKGATVTASKINPATLRKIAAAEDSAITDADGNFQLGIESGSYDIKSESGELVAFTPNVEVSDTVVPIVDTVKTPGKVEARFSLSGLAKRSASARVDDLSQGSCFIARVTPVYRADESGVCEIPEVPEGVHKITLEFPKFLAASESVVVRSGDVASLNTTLAADPGYAPPTPVLRAAVVERLSGVVVISWSPINVADLAGYSVFRNREGETTPVKVNAAMIADTIFRDSVFAGSNADSMVLEYRIKAQDTGLNISENYSNKIRVVVYHPEKYKSRIAFSFPAQVSIRDTVSVVASFANDLRKMDSVTWNYAGRKVSRALSGNSDSVRLSLDTVGAVLVVCKVKDEDGNVWSDSATVKVGLYPPVLKLLDTIFESRKPFVYPVSVSDPVGRIVEYAWDLDADGDFDTVTVSKEMSITASKPGRFILRVKDDDGNVATDTANYKALTYLKGTIRKDSTITKENGPYLVNLSIDTMVTLNVGPGVVMYLESNLNVHGNLNLNGTAEDSILIYANGPRIKIAFTDGKLPTLSRMEYADMNLSDGISATRGRWIEASNNAVRNMPAFIFNHERALLFAANNKFYGSSTVQYSSGFVNVKIEN